MLLRAFSCMWHILRFSWIWLCLSSSCVCAVTGLVHLQSKFITSDKTVFFNTQNVHIVLSSPWHYYSYRSKDWFIKFRTNVFGHISEHKSRTKMFNIPKFASESQLSNGMRHALIGSIVSELLKHNRVRSNFKKSKYTKIYHSIIYCKIINPFRRQFWEKLL